MRLWLTLETNLHQIVSSTFDLIYNHYYKLDNIKCCDIITMINKAKDRYKRLSKPGGAGGVYAVWQVIRKIEKVCMVLRFIISSGNIMKYKNIKWLINSYILELLDF